MKVHVCLEIKGDIDTPILWKLIESYKVNLTAVDHKTWIYGDVSYVTLGDLISKCSLFGDVIASIKR